MSGRNGNTCWVYVIHAPQAGTTKVGISNNPRSRFATIQTSCPYPIEMKYLAEFASREVAQEVERLVHRTFIDKRSSGEWFSLDFRTAIEAVSARSPLRAIDGYAAVQGSNLEKVAPRPVPTIMEDDEQGLLDAMTSALAADGRDMDTHMLGPMLACFRNPEQYLGDDERSVDFREELDEMIDRVNVAESFLSDIYDEAVAVLDPDGLSKNHETLVALNAAWGYLQFSVRHVIAAEYTDDFQLSDDTLEFLKGEEWEDECRCFVEDISSIDRHGNFAPTLSSVLNCHDYGGAFYYGEKRASIRVGMTLREYRQIRERNLQRELEAKEREAFMDRMRTIQSSIQSAVPTQETPPTAP